MPAPLALRSGRGSEARVLQAGRMARPSSSPRAALGPFELGPTGVAFAVALALALALKADALPMLANGGN